MGCETSSLASEEGGISLSDPITMAALSLERSRGADRPKSYWDGNGRSWLSTGDAVKR
jgi:hypothetical protein